MYRGFLIKNGQIRRENKVKSVALRMLIVNLGVEINKMVDNAVFVLVRILEFRNY